MENEYEGEVFEPLHLHDREAYHEDNDDAKEKYDVVPCLNDNDDHIKMMEHIVKKYLIN